MRPGPYFTAVVLLASSFGVGAVVADDNAGSILLRNASLVHPETGDVAADRCVWIRDAHIERISDCGPGASADRIVEGRGKWIIPGLWDMHVHAVWDTTAYRHLFADFVAWGVVGIRDMGGTAEALDEARQFLADKRNIGPALVAAGQVIDGAPPLQPLISLSATSYEEGRRAVARLDALGADFIKIYTMLPAEAVDGVFDEARVRGLKVAGHLPAQVSLADALRLGMATIEHMAVEIGGLCDVADRAACLRIFNELRAAGAYLTPTLLVRQRPGAIRDPQTLANSRITEMPPVLAAEWQASLDNILQQEPDSYFHDKSAQFERELQLTELAVESDARILVGTDSGDFLVPPGSSIHEELELLVKAGMSEKDALFAATGRAADYLGLRDRGRVREGAIADLVILDDNPLQDIRNTRKIAAVMLHGRLLDSAELECLHSRMTGTWSAQDAKGGSCP